jgi:WD40 repeat protein
VAGDLGLAVWDRTTAELTLGLQEFSLLTAAWSPDGSHIAAGTDFGQLLMYDVASADQVFLRSVGSSVLGLAWSPGGDMVASASDRIRLWDPATGAVLSELGAASIGSTSVDWSPDGVYLASGGSDRVIRVWGVADE